jgi:hypothetical protein
MRLDVCSVLRTHFPRILTFLYVLVHTCVCVCEREREREKESERERETERESVCVCVCLCVCVCVWTYERMLASFCIACMSCFHDKHMLYIYIIFVLLSWAE